MTVTDDNLVTVTLPSLGEDVEEATVSRWLVAPGDPIEVDTPLLEVATDKVDTEIPSPCAGVLLDIVVGEDQAVSIGAALATIAVDVRASATESSSPGPTPAAPVEQTEPARPPSPAPAPAPTPTPTPAEPAPDPAPAPVRIAVPATSTPIAPQAVAPEPKSPPNGTTVQRLPRIRQTIARRMMDSLHNSAQLTTVLEADVTSIANLRNHHKARFAELTGTKLSFLPFFAKAAIEAVARNPHQILLAVSRNDPAPFRAIAEAAGAGDRVRFIPPTNQIARYYAAADVFLFPTTYDAFGMVALEAMAMGLPIIINRKAGAAELVQHNRNGLLLENPFDAQESAACLLRLEQDPQWRASIEEAALATAQAQSWDQVAEATLAVYEALLAGKR